MRPRRQQTPITIRSDRVAERLKRYTAAGRSQAEVIEEAMDRLPEPEPDPDDLEARQQEIERIVRRLSKRNIPSMEEFDRKEYDENGNPR